MTSKRTLWNSFTSAGLVCLVGGACLVTVAGCTVNAEDASPNAKPSTSSSSSSSGGTEIVQSPPANPMGSGETVLAPIDNATGGTVALSDGTKIEVPAGALPEGVKEISVTSSASAAPTEYATVSPVYVFGPDGTVFKKPIKVSIPFKAAAGADMSTLTVLWSRARGDGFDMVPTEFTTVGSDVIAVASVTHFSKGMCGQKFTVDPHPTKDPYADK